MGTNAGKHFTVRFIWHQLKRIAMVKQYDGVGVV